MKHWRVAGPGLLLVLIVPLWSFGYAIYVSRLRSSLTEPARAAGFDNYTNLFASNQWWSSVAWTTGLSAVIAALQVFFGLLIAGILYRSARTRGFLGVLVLIPYVVFSYGSGRIWLEAIQGGFLSTWFGLDIGSTLGAAIAAVASEVWRGSGIAAFIVFIGLRRLAPETFMNARAEGATFFQRITRLLLPAIWPALAAAFFIRFIAGLGIFEPILAAGDAETTEPFQVLSTWLFSGFAEAGPLGIAAANAVVLLSALLVISMIVALGTFAVRRRRTA